MRAECVIHAVAQPDYILRHRTHKQSHWTGIMEASERQIAVAFPRSVDTIRRVGLGPLRHVPHTGSTNDDLIREARSGFAERCVLVADHQTAGRGRMGRRWRDTGPAAEAPGALLVSFRLPGAITDATGRMAAVSAAALSAVADIADPLTTVSAAAARPGAVVLSKWPNDIIVEFPSVRHGSYSDPEKSVRSPEKPTRSYDSGRSMPIQSGKLAGVLAESVNSPISVVVVGLGLNLLPVPAEPGSISLREMGVEVTRDQLLSRLLAVLPAYLADPHLARTALRSASATVGRRVRVEQADGAVLTGTAMDIDSQGRLVIDTSSGRRLVETGDVHHLRSITTANRSSDRSVGG